MTANETVGQGYKHPCEHSSSQKKDNHSCSCFLMAGSRQHSLKMYSYQNQNLISNAAFRSHYQFTGNSGRDDKLKDMQLTISPQESPQKDKGPTFINQ